MRIALPLAALIASTSCTRAKPLEVGPEPVASSAAPIPVAVPDTTSTPTTSGTAAADQGSVVRVQARATTRETLEEERARLSLPCPPMPAQRPKDFSILYEIYQQPIRGELHVYRQIVAEGARCQDDGGPALYYDGLSLDCLHAGGAILDRLYADLRSHGFAGMRQAPREEEGPRHHATRTVLRYQGQRCERANSFGIPIERASWDRYTRMFNAIRAAVEEIRSAPVSL